MSKELLLQAYRTIRELERKIEKLTEAAEPIAITGIGCRFPKAAQPDSFFDLLTKKTCAVREIPRERWNIDEHYDAQPGTSGKAYNREACFLDEIDQFDASFFQVAPREARMMDPQQRLLLEVAWEAMEQAGLAGSSDSSVGVFIGAMHLEYGQLAARLNDVGYWDVHSGTGCEMSVLAGRLSHFLQLRGPSIVVGTACSSALTALHLACQSLRHGDCRAALAGGVSLMLLPDMHNILCKMQALATDGRTRAFDDSADGYGRGEGCAVVALKRLKDAVADRDHIWGVILGSHINHDGLSGGLTVPSATAQEAVMRRAIERSGLHPQDLDYVEAHGTGTSLGDPIELAALASVHAGREPTSPLWIGSVKANVGHMESAAAMGSLVKVLLALQSEVLPGQTNLEKLNQRIPWDSIPIRVVQDSLPWPARPGTKRRAGISSFGLSGINGHMVIEEAPASGTNHQPPTYPDVVTLSAKTPTSLTAQLAALVEHLEANPALNFHDVCFSLNTGRKAFVHRWGCIVKDRDELLQCLNDALALAYQTDNSNFDSSKCIPECADLPGIPSSATNNYGHDHPDYGHADYGLAKANLAGFLGGQPVDWKLFYQDKPTRRLPLPTYRFDRQSYWVEPQHVPTSQADLPGKRIQTISSRELIYEWSVSPSHPRYLRDHRVEDQVLVPAAVMIQWIRRSMQDAKLNHFILDKLTIQTPIVVDSQVSLQLLIDTTSRELRIASSLGEQQPSSWVTNASGILLEGQPAFSEAVSKIEETESREFSVDSLRQRLNKRMPLELLRAKLVEQGLVYGPSFQGLCELFHEDNEALGKICTTGSDLYRPIANSEQAGLHPALLDACLQCAMVWGADDQQLHVPVKFGKVLGTDQLITETLWCYVVRKTSTTSSSPYCLDYVVVNDHGDRVAELHDVELQPVRAKSWIYDVSWESKPLATIADAGLGEAPSKEFWDELNAVCFELIQPAIRLYAQTPSAIASGHRRLLQYLQGLVSPAGSREPRPDGKTNIGRRIEQLKRELPEYSPELELVERVSEHFLDVVTGKKEAVEILFSNGLAERLYRESIVAKRLNARVIDELQSLLAKYDRPISILEIGAGSGGTTRQLLAKLGDRIDDYCFTDIGALFLSRAQQEFGSIPAFRTAILDAEKSPLDQGFAEKAFDVVVAANVLHATRDVCEALKNLKRLLASDGTLLLVEGTDRHLWLDITFGLTPGWWRFNDQRRDQHALLSSEQWRIALDEIGLNDISQYPCETLLPDYAGQAVISARKGSSQSRTVPVWLIIGESSSHSALEQQIRTWGHEAHRVSLEQVASESSFVALAASAVCRGVVLLLDTNQFSDCDRTQPSHNLQELCQIALATLQSVTRSSRQPIPIWIVTQRAQAANESSVNPAQSAVPGMLRSFRLEYPNWSCVSIDLDDATRTADWCEELRQSTDEQEVVYRNGSRWVPRLIRSQPMQREEGDFRLTSKQKGSLEQLHLANYSSRAPGANEVEVEIAAAGLNFLDVLDAMGALPMNRNWFGGECAGRIIAIGDNVTNWAVGQEVVVMAPHCLASKVTVDARLVARKPGRWTMAQAAGFPVAMLTAIRALAVAKLGVGDRVLIHAAAGGVGLAAIQVAQRAGATVFATAGSHAKRRRLRRLGIEHVYSSRTLDFRSKIMEATDGLGVTVVLNSLSDQFIQESVHSLASGGRFVEIGKRNIWSKEQVAEIRPDVQYAIYDLAREVLEEPAIAGHALNELLEEVEADATWKPLPVQTVAFGEANEAFRTMAQGGHFGKIVFTRSVSSTEKLWQTDPEAIYLITGAFSGLGLWMCQWLAGRGARRLMLWGRQQPSASAIAVLDSLKSLGCEVQTRCVDVSSSHDVAMGFADPCLAQAPLRGILHCAGVLDDGMLGDLNDQRYAKVLGPKAIGAALLHQHSLKHSLDWFVLFSSAASMLGSAGQSNHAAANAFLDGLSHMRRAQGLPSLSINWGAWSEIGAAARKSDAQQLNRRGIQMISPRQAGRALLELQQRDSAQLGVFPMQWSVYAEGFEIGRTPKFLEHLLQSTLAARSVEPTEPSLRKQLMDTPPNGRSSALGRWINQQVCRVLGRTSPIEMHIPLRDVGLDSLLAIEVCNQLSHRLETSISPTVLFDFPTLESLSNHLIEYCKLDALRPMEIETRVPDLSPEPELSLDELTALLINEMATPMNGNPSTPKQEKS